MLKFFHGIMIFKCKISASVYREEKYNSSNGVSVHSPPLLAYYPSFGRKISENQDLSLVHLNGIAGFYYQDGDVKYHDFILKENEGIFDFVKTFIKNDHGKNTTLTFAWEGSKDKDLILPSAVTAATKIGSKTSILAIIGYSFPFFNRRYDKVIMDSILSGGKLEKIYFQDPLNDGSFLRRQFNIPDSIPIEHIKRVDNYIVPMEL
jgi:hypothetical protein